MTMLQFDGVTISGIAACVPPKMIKINQMRDLMTASDLEKAIKFTGVEAIRSADADTCASDLCYAAALRLFHDLDIKPETVDMLIFVSQTPDYRLPATACTLQHRLNLPKSTAAFDMNLGCSGYVYGLSIAFSMASRSGVDRVLLLTGETSSKVVSPRDRSTALLFGDAGTATLIEKKVDGEKKAYFSLNTDGGREDVIKIKGGGFRFPSSAETLTEKKYEDGGIRNDEQIYMNGAEVFNFTIKDGFQDIKNLLQYANLTLKEIDYVVFHQANRFIIEHLTKKLGFPFERVPMSLKNFGNTSCATIPLTIVTEMREKWGQAPQTILLSGFGVGLSWATAVLEIQGCHLSDLVDF